jgi:hypothetical protein
MTFLLSILFSAKRILSAIWAWCSANPIRLAIIALIALCGFLALSNASLRGDVRHVTKLLTSERAAHIATKVNYANAQKIAADMNRKQVERIKNEYAAIAANSERKYDALLADSRKSVAEFVRRQKAESVAHGTTASGNSQVQPEVTGTGEMPDVSTGFAIVPVSDLDLVAGAYAKLWALQGAAIDVGKVETNSPNP